MSIASESEAFHKRHPEILGDTLGAEADKNRGACHDCDVEMDFSLLVLISGRYVCSACASKDDPEESYICQDCNGSGEGQFEGQRCWNCHGTGETK